MDGNPTRPLGRFVAAFFGMMVCYSVFCLAVFVFDRSDVERVWIVETADDGPAGQVSSAGRPIIENRDSGSTDRSKAMQHAKVDVAPAKRVSLIKFVRERSQSRAARDQGSFDAAVGEITLPDLEPKKMAGPSTGPLTADVPRESWKTTGDNHTRPQWELETDREQFLAVANQPGTRDSKNDVSLDTPDQISSFEVASQDVSGDVTTNDAKVAGSREGQDESGKRYSGEHASPIREEEGDLNHRQSSAGKPNELEDRSETGNPLRSGKQVPSVLSGKGAAETVLAEHVPWEHQHVASQPDGHGSTIQPTSTSHSEDSPRLASVISNSALTTHQDSSVNGSSTVRSAEKPAGMAEKEITGWPLPDSLLEELQDWERFSYTSRWAEAARETFTSLNDLRIDDPASLTLIEYGRQLSEQLAQHAQALATDQFDLACRLSRLAYRMRRRMEIWQVVHEVARKDVWAAPNTDSRLVAHAINQRHALFHPGDVPAEWTEYLQLETAGELFANPSASETRKRATARKILARTTSTSLTREQKAYAQLLVGNELGTLLRNATTTQIRLGQFLVDLESHEAHRAGNSFSADARINNHFQNFYWHQALDLQRLAMVFGDHYRNANFRLEVSDDLIDRIVARNMTYNEPVQDRILGAHVFGQSRIDNRISVMLIPDDQHLSFRLLSSGKVLSRTRAHSSGFVFNSLGNAMVNASKGISISPDTVSLLPADVEADSQQRLLGIRSRMDGVPFVGRMARRLAEQQQQSKSPEANSIVEQKLRNEFGTRVDEEIQIRIEEARTWIAGKILEPLQSMELEPQAVTMQTTGNSAIVRYRLAGLDQNASNSTRPQGLPNSLLNVQVHESAVNNILNRLQINGNWFTAPEFMQHIGRLLGRPDLELGQDEHSEVRFQFAPRDSIRLDFEDGQAAITLKLRRLQIDKHRAWRNLTVTAWYIPTARGLKIDMVLDNEKGVSLDGRTSQGRKLKLGDQVAVRTVFNALFQLHFEFPLLPAELADRPATRDVALSQIVLSDGWVGISASDIRRPEEKEARRQGPVWRGARHFRNRWR